ncbi:MAG: alginate lyase family protein, partial [Actinomycetes bacterium]
ADRRRLSFAAALAGAPLAGCDQLTARAHNRSATALLVEMILSAAEEAGGGATLRLFSGGREVLLPGEERDIRFPAEAFGFYGRERDWRNVGRLEVVFKKEKGDSAAGSIDVALGAVYAERRIVPPGPRLTCVGLTRRLRDKADVPAPPPVGPMDLSLAAPCAHFFPEDRADDVLAGTIMGQKLTLPIAWGFSPDGSQEWTHFLNRHHFLRPVLQAFLDTGEEAYAAFIEDVMCRWVTQNPAPLGSNGGAGPAWETLSAAWRLREWLGVWMADRATPFLSSHARLVILGSLWEHCRHLMDHEGHPNNWIILEAGALALAGMYLTEFRDASSWRREGLRRLRRESARQFLPDGAHFELSPFYHAHCLFVLLEVRKAATALGARLPAVLDKPLRRAADYLGALCRPDFTWPALNDSGGVAGDYAAVMRLAGEVLQRDDFRWTGTKGAAGKAPRRRVRVFASAGIAVMRTGYAADSHFVLFRAGPPGASHCHADVLSLDVSLAGVPCLVDPGISTYAPGPLTDHYRSAAAHNMILIDGRGPVRAGLAYEQRVQPAGNTVLSREGGRGSTISGACHDYEGGISGGAALVVTREIALCEGAGLVLRDTVAGAGRHRITVCWQFAPGHVTYAPETGSAVYENERGARIALVALPPQGLAPQGLAPQGLAPQGLAPQG